MRAANDWADLSGLWDRMEQTWGIKPMWAFTEAGPFESALDGWRSPNCLNGSINMYVLAMREWLEDVQQTSAYQEGRLYGFATFTTGGSQEWKYFETSQPELDVLANLTVEMWKPGEVVIPPQPPQQECLGEPRVQYHRVYNVIPQNATPEQGEEIFRIARDKSLETVGWSYDDAGVGGLNNRTARLWGIPASGQLKFANWYAQNYPGVIVEFVDLPGSGTPTHEIQDIVDDLPKHATKVYPTRSLQDITTLTIHHTVSPPDRPIEQIAAYHVDHNGWPGIGYHYVIKDTGEIFQTNYLETKSYHAGSYNAPGDENLWSVGIALQGDFTLSPPPQAQLDAAKWLVELLKGPLLGLQLNSVLGHREMPGAQTQCPGNTYPAWLNYVKGE